MTLLRSGSIAIGLLALALGGAPAFAQHRGGHGSGGYGFGGHGSFGHGTGSSFRSYGDHGRSVTFGTFYAPGGYYYGAYPYSGYGAYPYDYGYGYPAGAYGYRRSHHRRCRTVWEYDDYAGEDVPVRVCRR